MTTFCPQCGAGSDAPSPRYCDECGASLAGTSIIPAGNIVGDGSERAMTGVAWQSRRQSLIAAVRPGKLAAYAARAVVLVVGMMVVLPVLVHLLVVAMPLVLLFAFVSLRRNRRRVRRGRPSYPYRRHHHWAP